MKKLVILSSGYPLGQGDVFLTDELRYLPSDIDVTIIPSHYSEVGRDESFRENERLHVDSGLWRLIKISSILPQLLTVPFKGYFRRELSEQKKEGKLSMYSIKQTLTFCARGEYIKRYLEKKYRTELRNGDVTFYSYWLMLPAFAAALLKEKYGCSSCSRGHRGDIYELPDVRYPGRNRVLPMLHFMCEKLTSVNICSDNGKEYLLSKYPDCNIRCSRLGTNDHGLCAYDEEREPFTMVSLSAIVPVKRVDIICKALQCGKVTHPVRWIHIGDGTERASIEKLTEKMPSHVEVVLKGQLPHETAMETMKDSGAHLFINVSSSEGLPVSIMEAVSMGIPVIATDVGGTGELVCDRCGRLIDENTTPEQLADYINEIIALPADDYESLRRSARAEWEKGFSAENNYKKFYESIL